MALRLQKIELWNWKVYQRQTLTFNLDHLEQSQNIWIIFGQNGFGKTSLLEAMTWGLYGSDAVSKTTLVDYFNRLALKKNPTLDLCVQLTFQDGKNTFLISRSVQRRVRGTTVSIGEETLTFNRNGVDKKSPKEWIEFLLPRMCREFFFFDGVEIKRYAKKIHSQDTQDAIERILGIPELKNLRDDAQRALDDLQKKLTKVSKTNQELQAKNDQLEGIREEIETKQAQAQEFKEGLESAQEIHKSTQQEAAQIEDLRGQLEQLKRLESDSKRSKERLYQAEQKLEDTLKKAPIPLLLDFVQEVMSDLQSQTVTTARRSGSVKQLRDLLHSETCVCGRCLDDEARAHILQELERLERLGQATDRNAVRQDELRNRLAALSSYRTWNFEADLDERDRLADDLSELEQEIARVKRETHGINEEEARDIWRKVAQAESDVKEYENKLRQVNQDIERLKVSESQFYREIEKLAGQNKETETLARQVQLARGLHQATEELILWRLEERKETIEEKTSEVHRRVTNKPQEYNGIQINEDYTLGVRTVLGDVLNPELLSAGEKEALAFAFITGLNLASETAAPLVMDTPFGHLDREHQHNIVKALPNIPSQVIVLATDRDFPDDLLEELRPNIAEIFHISRLGVTEDASVIEEGE